MAAPPTLELSLSRGIEVIVPRLFVSLGVGEGFFSHVKHITSDFAYVWPYRVIVTILYIPESQPTCIYHLINISTHYNMGY